LALVGKPILILNLNPASTKRERVRYFKSLNFQSRMGSNGKMHTSYKSEGAIQIGRRENK
jgi:hypothetical protein